MFNAKRPPPHHHDMQEKTILAFRRIVQKKSTGLQGLPAMARRFLLPIGALLATATKVFDRR
jgi:hypothetical protein